MSHDARSDLDALRTSDEFLTALPHGADPSAGEDNSRACCSMRAAILKRPCRTRRMLRQ